VCLFQPRLFQPRLVEPGLFQPGLVEPGLFDPAGIGAARIQIGRSVDRGIAEQHALLELLELGTGVEAELVGELLPDAAVGGESVALPPTAVQRGDQQRPKPLPQRVSGDQRLELPDHLGGGAEVDAGRKAVLNQPEPDFFQPRPMRQQPLAIAGIAEDLPAEQRQGPGARLRCRSGICCSGISRAPLFRDGSRHLHHDKGVDSTGIDLEGVPASTAGQHGVLSEGPTEDGCLGLQRVSCGDARPGAPEILDQPVGSNGDTGLEGESDQQLSGLAGRQRNPNSVATEFGGSEHRDGEHSGLIVGADPGIAAI